MSVAFDQMSTWHEVLDSFVVGRKKRRDYRFFIVNLIAVNDGLRVGFLNDRHPFLKLKDSVSLLKTLQEKDLIKKSIHVLSIGNQEIVFVNPECLLQFVKKKLFKLVGAANSGPNLLPQDNTLFSEVENLIYNCLKDHDPNSSTLVLYPTTNVSGSTLLGICLGYPVIYLFDSDMSQQIETENLVVYEMQAMSKVPVFQNVQLFCFSVPQCIDDAVKHHIDNWHQTLVSNISDLGYIESVALKKNYTCVSNIAF